MVQSNPSALIELPASEEKIQEVLLKAAKHGMEYSLPRHSKFRVGAALLTSDGYVFFGGNWERKNPVSLGKSNCAEGSMLSALVGSGVKADITHILVIGGKAGDGILCTPCGTCRENLMSFLDEYGRDDLIVWVAGPEGVRGQFSMQELLPVRTGMTSFPDGKTLGDEDKQDAVAQIAQLKQEYLSKAYVPYSNYPTAAAVESEAGNLYYGVAREDAAYSGTSAVRSALSNMVLAEGPKARIAKLYMVSENCDAEIISPSGTDRQALREHCVLPERVKIYLPYQDQIGLFFLNELLPNSFGPTNIDAASEASAANIVEL